MINFNDLQKMSNAIRFLSVDAVQNANSGHPGMPLGFADVATVLFSHFLNFDASKPNWINRDRFILSAGHGAMLQYSLLYLAGYKKITLDSLKTFRSLNSICSGHPEIDHDAGIEVSTGPLGHGLAMAVGMAIAEKQMQNKYPDLINHKIYVVVGDGCLQEGVSYEAVALAGSLNLNNLVIIWDNNNITIDGEVNLASIENQTQRFKANNFHIAEIDGHDYTSIYKTLELSRSADQPMFISAKTKIAFGAPTKEGKSAAHGSPLGVEEINGLRSKLKWDYPPFVIPEDIKNLWEQVSVKNSKINQPWHDKFEKSPYKTDILNFFSKSYAQEKLNTELVSISKEAIFEKANIATRNSSKKVMSILSNNIPNLIGGCADLAASVMAKPLNIKDFNSNQRDGRYINFGVREHAMGAIANGLAAYCGFIPYVGTFLVFSDFMRPSIRLAAIQKLQVIFVFSHDSIAVGEDGPTHQPVETIPSLRLIPNLSVIRPCDTVEVVEAWQLALANKNGPTAILLSRQNLPTLRNEFDINHNMVAKGGYIIKDSAEDSYVNLIASGSEVELSFFISQALSSKGINTRIVSVPDLVAFKNSGPNYISSVIKQPALNVAIEASVITMYQDFLNPDNLLTFGVNDFGKSAKGSDNYEYFGLTKAKIVDEITNKLN